MTIFSMDFKTIFLYTLITSFWSESFYKKCLATRYMKVLYVLISFKRDWLWDSKALMSNWKIFTWRSIFKLFLDIDSQDFLLRERKRALKWGWEKRSIFLFLGAFVFPVSLIISAILQILEIIWSGMLKDFKISGLKYFKIPFMTNFFMFLNLWDSTVFSFTFFLERRWIFFSAPFSHLL